MINPEVMQNPLPGSDVMVMIYVFILVVLLVGGFFIFRNL